MQNDIRSFYLSQRWVITSNEQPFRKGLYIWMIWDRFDSITFKYKMGSNFQDPTAFSNSGVLPKLIRQRWGEKGVEHIPVKIVRKFLAWLFNYENIPPKSPEAKQSKKSYRVLESPFFKPRSFIVPGLQTVVLWLECHDDGVGTNPSLLVADWHTWSSMMPLFLLVKFDKQTCM